MSEFLTDDWLREAREALADLPEIEGADCIVQYVISGAPAGKVQAYAEIASGRVEAIESGKHADPSCTVTLTYEAATALFGGELRPEVAFMSGQAKVEGSHRAWLVDLKTHDGLIAEAHRS